MLRTYETQPQATRTRATLRSRLTVRWELRIGRTDQPPPFRHPIWLSKPGYGWEPDHVPGERRRTGSTSTYSFHRTVRGNHRRAPRGPANDDAVGKKTSSSRRCSRRVPVPLPGREGHALSVKKGVRFVCSLIRHGLLSDQGSREYTAWLPDTLFHRTRQEGSSVVRPISAAAAANESPDVLILPTVSCGVACARRTVGLI